MSVKVREKRKKLYLDIYVDGRRTWETLNLTVSSDPAMNKETMRLAYAQGLLPAHTFPRIRAENKANSKDYNISHANELISDLNALVKLKMGQIV